MMFIGILNPFRYLAALLLGFAFCLSAWADTPPMERIIWNKTPIRLTLQVGKERLVHFPSAVRINVPPEQIADLRTQSVDGTVYWLASSPFETTRILVQEIDSGRTFLFDLTANEKSGGTSPVTILNPEQESTTPLSKTGNPRKESVRLDYITLTRFAAQQMYAPTRLLKNDPRLHRISLHTPDDISLVHGGAVDARPLISWLGDGGRYVTVVRLRNRSDQPLSLDPRDLRGKWLAATFQHARLLPTGHEADTTSVYLISTRPFEESF
ncbi:MAG: TIGR03749 family integrating conjugative element protein [gamma proteobacterium endosymbiont of Lamellibrachia anaximandri]|nr:TIGR03749 family integrating conjugative element protein [gamma proteobacterium endosymbiont of Lamellibrachia anaximandri]